MLNMEERLKPLDDFSALLADFLALLADFISEFLDNEILGSENAAPMSLHSAIAPELLPNRRDMAPRVTCISGS